MPIADAAKLASLESPVLTPIRDGFGQGLVAAGEADTKVVALCCDLTESTRCLWFKERFPERFVEIGIAEQNMASVAAGMSLMGKIPFIASYAMFSPGRNWEQIRTTVSYNKANVKIVGAHAGISVGPDGATHQALEDVAIMRCVPNMTVIVPCDAVEAKKATLAAAQLIGPVYLRLAREKTPVVSTTETPFAIGLAQLLWNAQAPVVGIVANGPLVYEALVAASELERQGIQAVVLNCHTVKPLDEDAIISLARRCGAVVTAEEHQVIGGLGSAVSELIVKSCPVPMQFVGVHDQFGESGAPGELMQKFGLTSKEIITAAKEAIAAKNVLTRISIQPCDDARFFRIHGGGCVRSLPELYSVLLTLPPSVFLHHVAGQKNDFAAWTKEVFHQAALAARMRGCQTPIEMHRVLRRFLRRQQV